ncbi:MAG TPA: polysaccharide deacetylase family protein, partial [Puia sp.]|nr:polysaccharide deacetylase family protein [Puia sp.]
ISKELFDEEILITSDAAEYARYPLARLNYSDEAISDDDFFIRRTPLLFQKGIETQPIECFDLNYHKVFFETEGDFPFDMLAASFYLLSRYEEYLPHEKDEYGRFAHTGSLAYREGFLNIPLVNIWLREFKAALSRKYPTLRFRYPSFKFIPTYDIDMAYSYLHKGWKRNMAGLLRSLIKGEWARLVERVRVLRRRQQDPFDAYEWLDSLHLYCRMKAYYFFLVAGRPQGLDKNITPSEKAMQELVRYHASGAYRVGLHPSWQSGDEEMLLKEEVEWMECMTEEPVSRSRQHYIRLTLPQTYRRLMKAGIVQDFSMGYGSINGFRASVASSFYWYDLEKEAATELRIFPFCFMDANAFYEQKYTAGQAMNELMHYYHLIRKVNGLMITIWHNSFLGSDPQFAGWREVYETFLREEVYWDA